VGFRIHAYIYLYVHLVCALRYFLIWNVKIKNFKIHSYSQLLLVIIFIISEFCIPLIAHLCFFLRHQILRKTLVL